MNDKPRLIDAGALSLEIYKRINSIMLENEELTAHDALIEAMKLIKEVPTVDAVPVVRCRDCKMHDSCSTEDVFKFTGLSADRTFCAAGAKMKGKDGDENASK